MLEKMDLSKSIQKKEYEDMVEEFKVRMGELQRKAWKMGIPIIVVFEGWHASGMTEIINRFLMPLSPMGFELYTTGKPCPLEEQKPLIWRFWTKVPQRGKIVIFDRSWYRRALLEHLHKEAAEENITKCLNGLTYFERQLADDGYMIIKFFLHISKKKQDERYEEILQKGIPLLLVKEDENDTVSNYERYLPLIEKILEKTDIPHAPWTIVESDDLNFATVKIMQTFILAIEGKMGMIEDQKHKLSLHGTEAQISNPFNSSVLKTIDLNRSLPHDEYKEAKKKYQKELEKLQYELFKQGRPVIIVFEGWDASGKGGSIRRLAQILNPRLYKVIPVGVPSDVELAHHYMWRFYNELPEAGHITIFDRSWYGRVLVERVECFCSSHEWKRAYREINEFEEVLTNNGTIIIKFWMHIDKKEQLHRFREREKAPHKQWKITPDDWNNRNKWEVYEEAVDEMLQRTSTTYAPWTIVESNDKSYSRIKVLRVVVETLQKELKVE
jgi:polyphosphate:AMP phosphotransferase